jgi:hypothetical protein
VTVIVSLIVTSARAVVGLHLGAARGGGRAHGRRRGQLSGTQIPHARRPSGAPRTLAVTMIEAALVALPMTPSRALHDQPPHGVAAVVPTIDLPAVALAADREGRMATRAHGKSMVGHVLARADLLPGTSSRARLRAVDASSRDLEGRELSLLAFTNFGARPVPRSRERRRSRNLLRPNYWPRITRIGVAGHNE